MGIGRSIWALRIATLVAMAAALPVARLLGLPEAKVLMPVMVVAVGGYLLAERLLVRRGMRELREAAAKRDGPRTKELIETLRPLHAGDPNAMLMLELSRGSLLSAEGKWSEARTVFEKVLELPVEGKLKVSVQNNLAWALMHLGVTGRALELSAEAVREGERLGSKGIGFYRGTYAIGTYLAGRAADAAPMIEQVMHAHAGDGAEAQAIRSFYLGEAYADLKRGDEARIAYERVVREAPQSRWAEQARAKL